MRKALALLSLGLLALAQEVVVYPGFAEVREPVVLPPGAWVYLAGEKLSRTAPGSLRLLGVEEVERVYQGSAVLFRYQGEGPATLRYLYTGLTGEVFYTLEEGMLTLWTRLRLEGEPLEAKRLTLLAGEAPSSRPLPPPRPPCGPSPKGPPTRKTPSASSAMSFPPESSSLAPRRSPF